MHTGYHPARVRALLARTAAAIDDLAAIHCADPAAADACRTVRLARRTLEDHWMPLLHDIVESDAMTSWTPSTVHTAWARPTTADSDPAALLARVRDEWARTNEWLTPGHGITARWSDRRLIDAVVDHDHAWRRGPGGAFADPLAATDDLFADAMHEIAARVARDADFADALLAAAGDTATLGHMVAHGPFGDGFTAAVARRLLSPGAGHGLLADERARHARVTGSVLDVVRARPDLVLDLLGDPDVRSGLVWRTDLDTVAVREFVASGLHVSVLADPGLLQQSLDALAGFVPLADRTTFPPGVSQGIAAAVGTHMTHLGPLLDVGTATFRDVAGDGVLDVDGIPVSWADLESLYGRVVRDGDAQLLVEVALTDYLAGRLDAVPAAVDKAAGSALPPSLGDVVRSRIEPAVKALVLVFGSAAAHEQQRVDTLHARRREAVDRVTGTGLTLLGAHPTGKPVSKVLDIAKRFAPRPAPATVVPDNAVLANLDGVVAREALRLVVADDRLRAAAGLDVVDDATWARLTSAVDDPTIDFTHRGTVMRDLGIDGADAVLVETFLAQATGTIEAIG